MAFCNKFGTYNYMCVLLSLEKDTGFYEDWKLDSAKISLNMKMHILVINDELVLNKVLGGEEASRCPSRMFEVYF